MISHTLTDPPGFVEAQFGIAMRKVGRAEWAGPCPWCAGRDRFHVWDRGNFWCRPGPGHCGRSGWLDELEGATPSTKADILRWRVEALERKQQEHERRLSVLERMHKCQDHLRYHRHLDTNVKAVDYWLGEGMNADTIHHYKLGYCPDCPTSPGHDSYTIPVTYQGKLFNIRHRLVTPNGGKYRPHMAGLPSMIFNADHLDRDDGRILILEGEKKSMVVTEKTDIANVATMGKQSFKPGWASRFGAFERVYVCYDPDATAQASATAALFSKRGYVVTLPTKADDFFVLYGGSASDFEYHINTARPATHEH